MTPQLSDLPERFRKHVVVASSGCWLWTGCITRDGHGQYRNGKTTAAHRYAYEVLVGPIPAGVILRHKCDTPNCVNPAHILPGSHQDNVRDRVERGRSAVGERNGRSKLTAKQVEAICNDLLGGRPPAAIAQEHGVGERAVRWIRDGGTWRHATP